MEMRKFTQQQILTILAKWHIIGRWNLIRLYTREDSANLGKLVDSSHLIIIIAFTTTKFTNPNKKYLEAVVRPRSELHSAFLVVKWKIGDVYFTRAA